MADKLMIRILQDAITLLQEELFAARKREEDLKKLVEEQNIKLSSLQKTLDSLTSSLEEQKEEAAQLRNQNRGMGKLLSNKSEKQQKTTEETSSVTKNVFDPKSRGNNGAKRKEHFHVETKLHEVYPSDAGFEKEKSRIIGYVDTIRYTYHPGWFVKNIYRQYNCSVGEKILRGQAPKAPLLNSSYDGSFIAGMLQMRYIYSMPVERIVKFFNEQGIDVCKQTAHGLINKSAGLLERLYEILKKTILEDSYLSMDETYYKVLVNEKNEAGKKVRKGYLWSMYGNHCHLTAFVYEQGSRSKEVVRNILKDYKGALHTDGYAAYGSFGKEEYPDIVHLACFQHCKRKFLDIKNDVTATEVVNLINELYHKEHLIPPEWKPSRILAYRQEYAPPVLRRLKEKLEMIKVDPHILPKSELGEATRYTLNLYDTLCNYIRSADYRLDNNCIERINRYVSLSRRNSLFAGSHAGAKRMAIMYSLACSARLHKINTFEYFSDILNRLADIQPNANDDVFRNLLPDRWSNNDNL